MFMLRRDGRTFGPFSAEEIRELLSSGSIASETQAAPEGTEDWGPVSLVTGQFSESASPVKSTPFSGGGFTPPAQQSNPPANDYGSSYQESPNSSFIVERPPIGIILVSSWFALGALFFVFLMVMALLLQHAPQIFIHRMATNPLIKAVGGGFYTLLFGLGAVIGIIAMAFCAFYGYLAYSLYTFRNWARITAIVMSCIGILNQFQSCVFQNAIRFSPSSLWMLVPFAISCSIIVYLNSANVKRLFS